MVDKFVKVFDDVLPANTCEKLCDYARGGIQMDRFDYDQCPSFWKGYFNPDGDQKPLHDHLVDHVKDYSLKYFKHLKYDLNMLPQSWGLEALTLKRYDPGDRFNKHVDITDYPSARRWLAMQFYLNDDFKGGKTIFDTPTGKLSIAPKTGRLLIFPPNWQYPHTGAPVLSGQKFLLTTYLHFKTDD